MIPSTGGSLLERIRRVLGVWGVTITTCDGNASQQVEDQRDIDFSNPFPEPVVVQFPDVIDLHSIPPRLVKTVVEDYLEEAHSRGIRSVRIIHGKGIGVQREMVRSIMARSEFVAQFQDASTETGGWGATVATLSIDLQVPGQR